MESFRDEIECCTDETLERIEHIFMERKGCTAAPAVVAPIGTALAQLCNPRSRTSGISFDVRVCMEESTQGKMDPERGALESSSAGTGLEGPEQQCLLSWELHRTTTTICFLT